MHIKTFTVFFEICGKKMKTEVPAASQNDAREKLIRKLIIHEVREPVVPDPMDLFKSIFNWK